MKPCISQDCFIQLVRDRDIEGDFIWIDGPETGQAGTYSDWWPAYGVLITVGVEGL